MTKEAYFKQAMTNLQTMSRTVKGKLDISASADKKDNMSVTDGETAKNLALSNYEEALNMAWNNRYRDFSDSKDLRLFIENLARQVNHGILKDGVLYRNGTDIPKYNYAPVDKIESSACWFYDHLFSLLYHEPYDAVEAAASAEYYINLTTHFFADGCGKCSMLTAAWLLMRGDHLLPVYPGFEAYYSIATKIRCAPTGSDMDREDFTVFLSYYRSLFADDVQ